MATIQNGVLEKSKMFFYPPPQNKELFFYPVSVGHFYCNSDYRVERDNFDSILITYIIRGSFSFMLNGKEQTAHSGEVVLIDCFKPHTYYTNDDFEAYWIHINGANVYELYSEITNRFSSIIYADAEEIIKSIYSVIKTSEKVTESEMSLRIYELLIKLFENNHLQDSTATDRAIEYISLNYAKNLNVKEISDFVHLSPSQFSRKFKKQTGTSPYDYLLGVRLTRAKELLKNTSLSISEIAYQTGFQSDSNFIYFFKRQESISPLKFRKLLF